MTGEGKDGRGFTADRVVVDETSTPARRVHHDPVVEVAIPARVFGQIDFWTSDPPFAPDGRTRQQEAFVGRRAGDGAPVLRLVIEPEAPAGHPRPTPPLRWGERVVCEGNGHDHPYQPSCRNPRRVLP